jgi:tetratricopeptide (TPR) repeat protein
VESLSSRKRSVSRYRGPAIFFGIIGVALAAYVAWYLSQDDDDDDDEPNEQPVTEIGPLSDDDLRDLLRSRGVKGSEVVLPFKTSEAVEEFAKKASRGKVSPAEKARALLDSIRARVTANHEHYVSIQPRRSPPLDPEETLAALQSDDPFEPYPYEIAALMITACRSVSVPAVMAEVYKFANSKRPADPSGVQGYYVAALPRGDSDSYRRPILYDPASGRFGDSAEAESDVMTDLDAVAARLGLQALYEAAHRGDTGLAGRLTGLAVKLRPSSATTLAARGTVMLLTGDNELTARTALEEYEKALRIRPDAQRKVLIARILLATGQGARAEELIRSALSDTEEFAAAHGILGLLHLTNDRVEEAQASLTRAQQLEPRDPHIALLWVQYHMAQHDVPAAIEAAQAVVDSIPDDPQPRLMLTQVLYTDARYDAAETQCYELIRRNPDNDQLRELMRRMFDCDPSPEDLAADGGPSAIASADEGDAGLDDGGYDDDDGGSSGGLQLQMGKGLGKVRLGGAGGFQLGVEGM